MRILNKAWGRLAAFSVMLSLSMILSSSSHAIIRAESDFPDFLDNAVLPLRIVYSLCTATLIGPKTILTAGHCAFGYDGESTESINVRINGYEIQTVLTHNPEYTDLDAATDSKDFAIGILAEAVPESLAKPISLDLSPLKKGDEVVIAGYGKQGKSRSEDGGAGLLSYGKATINSISKDFMVLSDHNQAITDEGDSGGPVLTKKSGAWYVSGTISGGKNLRFIGTNERSYLTQLSNPSFKKFLDQMIAKYNIEICGVNKNCSSP